MKQEDTRSSQLEGHLAVCGGRAWNDDDDDDAMEK